VDPAGGGLVRKDDRESEADAIGSSLTETEDPTPNLDAPEEDHGPTFWVGLTIGWVAISTGLFGILDHQSAANPFKVFRLLVGLNIFNDAIVVPLVLGLALAVRRWAPHWLLAPIQTWLIISGVVSLYAYPLIGAFGKKPSQPSELPFNYAHNLLIVLGCITLFCSVLAIRSWRRDRRTT
jgi:hypothetical protein